MVDNIIRRVEREGIGDLNCLIFERGSKDAYIIAAYRIAKTAGAEVLPFELPNIETIRKIKDITKTGNHKMIIYITAADRMLPGAQAAMLKIIEEPPANVLYILTTSLASLLPATIISRSQVIPLLNREAPNTEIAKLAKSVKEYMPRIDLANVYNIPNHIEFKDEEDPMHYLKFLKELKKYYQDNIVALLHIQQAENALKFPSIDKQMTIETMLALIWKEVNINE